MEYINLRRKDKNIVLGDFIRRNEEIHTDKLEKQIVDLQEEIENIPEPISDVGVSDERVIDLIEIYNGEIPDTAELEIKLQKKQDFLAVVKAVK